MKPICFDLYCGLGGWTEGFLSEGYDVIGFDITMQPYAGQRVIQDVTTIHGAQFADADIIVASPPCQEFSYRAMPWKRAKAQVPDTLPEWWNKPEAKMDTLELAAWHSWRAEHPADLPLLGLKLFWACFRIQHEACEASGRYIPIVIENVKGAQKWVGEAQAHFGSYYLWGDVRAVGRKIVGRPEVTPLRFGEFTAARRAVKCGGSRGDDWFAHHNRGSWFGIAHNTESGVGQNPDGRKVPGMNFHDHEKTGKPGRSFQSAAVASLSEGVKQHGSGTAWFDKALDERRKQATEATKCGGDCFGSGSDMSITRRHNSKSDSRKAASAAIAKIPFPLAQHIARVFKPAVV